MQIYKKTLVSEHWQCVCLACSVRLHAAYAVVTACFSRHCICQAACGWQQDGDCLAAYNSATMKHHNSKQIGS